MADWRTSFRRGLILPVGALALSALYLISRHNYLLFHSLAEIFSVVVACGIFMVAWNARQILDNHYFLFIGVGYLFVGGIEMIHSLAYPGLGVLQGEGPNLAAQLWTAARFVEAGVLLLAPLAIRRRVRLELLLSACALVTALLLLSIFTWRIFPDCSVPGAGLTPFKRISGYAVAAALLLALGLLVWKRRAFDRDVRRWLALGLIAGVGSELALTAYGSVYAFSNMLGHLLKVVSFYLIYRAVVVTGLMRPYDLLFRNLTESEEKYRHLFEAEPDGLVMIDAETLRYLDVNEAAVRMFGYARDDLLNMTVMDLSSDPEIARETVQSQQPGQTIRVPLRYYRRQDGTLFPVEIYSGAFVLRGRKIVCGAVRDITDRLRADEALRQRSQELEAANHELEAFSYSVSHDLKGPLRVMEGFARILIEDQADRLDDKGRRYLTIIQESCARMDRLINDLLAFSRLGRQEMRSEPVEMAALAREVWAELAPARAGRQVAFTCGPLPPATGDPGMLRQVFSNLLGNAIKFTAPRPEAAIEVGAVRQARAILYFVKDNGVGFDMQYAGKLFRVFQRLHRIDEFEGTGVGLAIVKRIVDRHGGCVFAEGKSGQGACLQFWLPDGA